MDRLSEKEMKLILSLIFLRFSLKTGVFAATYQDLQFIPPNRQQGTVLLKCWAQQ